MKGNGREGKEGKMGRVRIIIGMKKRGKKGNGGMKERFDISGKVKE